MNAQAVPQSLAVPTNGYHRRVFDCILSEVADTERYCRSGHCVGPSDGFSRALQACDHSATLIHGMVLPYLREANDPDRQLYAFAELASGYVRTLWKALCGVVGPSPEDFATRQRYRAEVERLTGASAPEAAPAEASAPNSNGRQVDDCEAA